MPRRKQKHTPITADGDYAKFLNSIEPILIWLADSRIRIDRDDYFTEQSTKLSLSWHGVPADIGDDYFEADTTLVVKLNHSDKSKSTVEINATFRIHFHAPKPINRTFIDRFTDSEIRIIIWPYFREYVSNLSGRMHIPPIILPLGTKE